MHLHDLTISEGLRLISLIVERLQIAKRQDSVFLFDVNANDDAVFKRELYLQVAMRQYALRRKRGEIIGADIFGEPCWDILLDLYIQKHSGNRVSVTSACIASSVPPTTALRWISFLENEGLIERTRDDSDQRRHFVTLSQSAEKKMDRYFVEHLKEDRSKKSYGADLLGSLLAGQMA